jgi:uncharacterized damage-inducible protein DinB
MLQKSDLGRLLEYTVWANHRIVRVAATLTVEEFKRDLGSSHGGVRGTLAHMLGGEWIWLERWKGVSPPRLLDEAEFPDVMALRERWKGVEDHRQAWFGGLKKGAASAPVRYRTTERKEFAAPLWQLVQHVVNHSTYHRGQVTTLLRLLGAKTVSTDIVVWDRERASRPQKSPAG